MPNPDPKPNRVGADAAVDAMGPAELSNLESVLENQILVTTYAQTVQANLARTLVLLDTLQKVIGTVEAAREYLDGTPLEALVTSLSGSIPRYKSSLVEIVHELEGSLQA